MGTSIDDYEVELDAFHLRDALQRVLDTVIAVYASYGVPLPARQHWMLGETSEECEQVVVSFMQMYLGTPGDEAQTPQDCSALRSAVMNISVTRDFPIGSNGKAVSPARIMSASDWMAVDAWILMDSVNQFDNWDGHKGPGVIATVQAANVSGGLQTTNMQLTLAIQ